VPTRTRVGSAPSSPPKYAPIDFRWKLVTFRTMSSALFASGMNGMWASSSSVVTSMSEMSSASAASSRSSRKS